MRALEFIDDSVEKMQDAALLIRSCSGEKFVQNVEQYITKVSVSSFRDFDKDFDPDAMINNHVKVDLRGTVDFEKGIITENALFLSKISLPANQIFAILYSRLTM